MATTKTLHIPVDSDLGRLLHDAMTTGDTVVIDTGEATYRLDIALTTTEPTPSRTRRRPTPEKVAATREAIRAAAGSWKDVDVEAFKEYIAERRRTANRPPVKL